MPSKRVEFVCAKCGRKIIVKVPATRRRSSELMSAVYVARSKGWGVDTLIGYNYCPKCR